MEKLSTLLIAGMFSFGTAAFAQDDVNFEELDQDGDGQLSRTEVAQNGDLAANFSRLDADGDGYLAREEAQTASMKNEGDEYRAVSEEDEFDNHSDSQSQDVQEISADTEDNADTAAETESEEGDWQ